MSDTQPTILQLSKAYGISTAYWHRISSVAGIEREDWHCPDRIFKMLLGRNASPLRQKLADPGNRSTIAKSLSRITNN